MSSEDVFERTLLCLSSPESRGDEQDIVSVLENEYGLKLKQRTERIFNSVDAEQISRKVIDIMVEEVQEKFMNEAPQESKEEEFKEEMEEARRQDILAYREKQLELFQKSINTDNSDDLIVLAFTGTNAVSILLEAINGNEALKRLRDGENIDSEEMKMPDTKMYWLFPSSSKQAEMFFTVFFGAPPMTQLLFEKPQMLQTTQTQCVKLQMVDIKDLLAFLFPQEAQHPWSTGRLLVYGEYGPLDDHGYLRGGIRGEYIIRKSEIREMVRQIDRTDLSYIYVGNAVLSPDEQREILAQVDPRLVRDKQISVGGVQALFENLDRDQNGLLYFHQVQQVIFTFRRERIKRWKRTSANTASRDLKKSKSEIEIGKKHSKAIQVAGKIGLRIPFKVDDRDQFQMTSKLLNRHSFEICNMEDKNSPSLVQNVQILKNYDNNGVEHGATPWWKTYK